MPACQVPESILYGTGKRKVLQENTSAVSVE